MVTIREKIGALYSGVQSGNVAQVIQVANEPVTAPSKKRKKKKRTGEPTVVIPEGVTDIIKKGPIVGGFEGVLDLWTMILGTPRQKTETLGEYVPIDEQTYTEAVSPIIGADPGEYPELDQPILTFPGIEPIKLPELKLPDFGGILSGIGTGALLVGGLILAIMLLKK